MRNVLHYIRRLAAIDDSRSCEDRVLLHRYVDSRDESAFAALLERHGPMVLAAARRVLQNEQDAEDVLQATFLVFARKAATIRRGESLRSWLYGIGYRLALKARAKTARQRTAEHLELHSAPEAMTVGELQPILDEELQRLPEKYRLPILLCCLEGKSRDEAARELGWKEGAVKIRLERGREMLRTYLRRRGIALPMAMASAWLLPQVAQAAMPTRLSALTLEAAGKYGVRQSVAGMVPANVSTLAEGMVRTMAAAATRSWILLATGILVVAGIGGLATWTLTSPAERPSVLLASNPVAADHAPAAAKTTANDRPERSTVSGTLRSANESRTQIIIRDKEKDVRIDLAPDCDIRIEENFATLQEVKIGSRVEAEIAPNGRAVALRAEGPIARMRFESIEVDGSQITFASGEAGRKQQFPLREIARADALARLTAMPAGSEIVVQLSHDRSRIVRIVEVPTVRTKSSR